MSVYIKSTIRHSSTPLKNTHGAWWPHTLPTMSSHMTRSAASMYTLLFVCVVLVIYTEAWTPILVKKVIQLGPQITPDVTHVSRDGGYSVLLNGHIVWLYDDTECLDLGGKQLSFVSNTAAYATDPNKNVSILQDFGVEAVGREKATGMTDYAILADRTVGTGGWIPFSDDELDFNKQRKGKERVAICNTPMKSDDAGIDTSAQGLAPRLHPIPPPKHFSSRLWSMSTASPKILRKSTKPEG